MKRAGGSILAAARPKEGQKQLDLAFLRRRYPGGGEATPTDFLDAAGRRYVDDARRLHADARYTDRAYGNVVHESNGPTWLQYWFFYYYNGATIASGSRAFVAATTASATSSGVRVRATLVMIAARFRPGPPQEALPGPRGS